MLLGRNLLQTVYGDLYSQIRINSRTLEAYFHIAQIMLCTYHSYGCRLNLGPCITYACIHILWLLNLSDVTSKFRLRATFVIIHLQTVYHTKCLLTSIMWFVPNFSCEF